MRDDVNVARPTGNPELLRPVPGTSFALPPYSCPEVFESYISEYMRLAPKSQYLKHQDDLIQRTNFGLASELEFDFSLTRGAEDALFKLVAAWRPNCLVVPEFSYPGYRRVSRFFQISLQTYSNASASEEISKLANKSSAMLVITRPGNPENCPFSAEQISNLRRQWEGPVVIDAAYQNFISSSFWSDIKALACGVDAILLSFSKIVPLAGLRLGGILAPTGTRPVDDSRTWDILAAATFEAFAEPNIIAQLQALYDAQERRQRALKEEFQRYGGEVLGDESPLFLTIRAPKMLELFDSILSEGTSGVKLYSAFERELWRIDVGGTFASTLVQQMIERRSP